MATKKTTPSKPVKKAAAAKKAPAKAAPAKKAVAKKTVPVKKAVPAKKVAPAKKASAPAKKAAAPAKKVATPAKKVAPAKKAASVKKKVAPIKKAAAPAKKAPVKKSPAAKTVSVKQPTKKASPAPAAKKAIPAPKVSPAKSKVAAPKTENKPATVPSKPVAAKPVIKKGVAKPQKAVVVPQDNVRAEIRDAVRTKPKIESKPGTVVAHRVLDRKTTKKEDDKLTMKEYNPPTRSLLDEAEQHVGPVYRYSDEELNEFRELILKRLESARENLSYYQALITRKDEAGTDDTDNRFNHMEDGSGAMEREQLSQLAARQIQFINHLEKALIRIENKTYGICRVTGKLIDKARLRAVPHATLSIEAKTVMNK